jgi:hypothetical protein
LAVLAQHDSAALFAQLINEPKGGHAHVELDAAPTSRSYETATNILTTSFEGALGRATLTDFMPIFRSRSD